MPSCAYAAKPQCGRRRLYRYNTYPGWKTSDVVRDAMQLNSFAATTQIGCNAPRKCWGCSSRPLGWQSHEMGPGQRRPELAKQSDYYLFHEYLETVNSPCYFLEFVAAIRRPDWFIWPTRNCARSLDL